jgi:hypothetical protein
LLSYTWNGWPKHKIADLKLKIVINDRHKKNATAKIINGRHKKLKIADKNLQQEKLYTPGH